MVPSKYLRVRNVHGFKLIIFAVCPRTGRYLSFALNQEYFGRVLQVSDYDGSFFDYGNFKDWIFNYISDLGKDCYDLVGPEKMISLFNSKS